jgi:nucleoside-diphosphate-sugar epimerase
MRVLVTGGTGYLGQAIVRALAARGHEPVVYARTAASSGLPGRLVDGDVRDAGAVARAADGCEAICHTAALVSLWRRRPEDFDDVNLGGLEHAIEAARTRSVPRLVYTSSFLALPPAGSPAPLACNDYQRTKVRADAIAAQAVARGVPIVRTYPGVIYGPGPATEGNLVWRMVSDHLAGKLLGLIGADRPWSYAFIDDVAAGHVTALEQGAPGERYVLGGENAPQMRVFEIVRELTGRPLPRRIPFALASAIGALEDARAAITRMPPTLTRGTVTIFRHDWSLDSRAAIDRLGYRITPLRAGLARMLEGLSRPPLAPT